MKLLSFATIAAFGLLAVGCEQSTATTTTQQSATTGSSYKLTGNRSADPLGNYSPNDTNPGAQPSAASAGLAQRAGTASMGAHR